MQLWSTVIALIHMVSAIAAIIFAHAYVLCMNMHHDMLIFSLRGLLYYT